MSDPTAPDNPPSSSPEEQVKPDVLSGGLGGVSWEEGEENQGLQSQQEPLMESARALLRMSPGSNRHQNNQEPVSAPEAILSEVGKVVLKIPAYPATLIHVLIQLGYEPVPPQRRYSIVFRRYMYYYPGIYGYAKAIVQQDGWKALYRGVGANTLGEIVAVFARGMIVPLVAKGVEKLPLSVVSSGNDVPDTEENVETARAVVVRATRMFIRGVVTQSVVTLLTHPLRVITVRSIAEYIGREEIYSSVWQSVKEIYQDEGIAGFYSGIVPSILGCIYNTALCVTLWSFFELLAINAPQVVLKVIIRQIIEMPLLAYIPRTYSYPFQLMSNVMAINNCRLAAGMPPRMPVYNGWSDCYHHLRSSRLLYRGSVVIFPRFAYKDLPGTM